jgi:ABC-2 type transport system permease protein
MLIYLMLISVALAISLFLTFKKVNFPKLEKVIRKISLYSLIIILICVILSLFDIRLKWTYATSIIGLIFLLSTIILYGITKNKLYKNLSGALTIPLIILGILSPFIEGPIALLYLIAMPFQPPIVKSEINETYSVEIRDDGFLPCTESLIILESKFWIFDKQQNLGTNFCLTGINKIEPLIVNKNKVEFLIYHDGQTKRENPYKYKAEIKNVW